MAYKTLVAKPEPNRAAALADLWATIEAMGWVLHDDRSASSYKVYKSDGELGDRIPEYIKIDWATADRISAQAFYYWNATTHTGYGANTFVVYVTTSESGFYLWIYGNKNMVFIIRKLSSGVYNKFGFGHLPKRYWSTLTTLTAGASSGSNVTITVEDTSDFIAGNYYQIVGAAGEGRDRVQVTSIVDATHMIIASLPRGYNAGAKIGQTPSTFGVNSSDDHWITCPADAVGTNNYGNACSKEAPLITGTNIDPDYRGDNKYLLTPVLYSEYNLSFLGYIDEYYFNFPTSSPNPEDMIGVMERDMGTADSGTSTTLTDNGKSWTGNAWAGKVVIIKFGTGMGQIRKIVSNDATTLTISEPWTTTVDSTSEYVICDEGYRYFDVNGDFAYREGV